MLKKDEHYSNAEGEILKHSSDSVNYFKDQMKDLLDAKIKSQSAVTDSVSEINSIPTAGYSAMQGGLNNFVDNNPVQTQDKVRVRKMEGPIKSVIPPGNSVNDNSSNYQNGINYSGGMSYPSDGSNSSNYIQGQGSISGVSNTFILLAAVVLIFLVFLVSTAMIMYFGLK